LQRYASLFSGLTQGAEGSAKREALDATLVAFENRLGHMMAVYDVADAPAGFLDKWETTFRRKTECCACLLIGSLHCLNPGRLDS
jgi:hypothetical protein